jgi:hypothetical protein
LTRDKKENCKVWFLLFRNAAALEVVANAGVKINGDVLGFFMLLITGNGKEDSRVQTPAAVQ